MVHIPPRTVVLDGRGMSDRERWAAGLRRGGELDYVGGTPVVGPCEGCHTLLPQVGELADHGRVFEGGPLLCRRCGAAEARPCDTSPSSPASADSTAGSTPPA